MSVDYAKPDEKFRSIFYSDLEILSKLWEKEQEKLTRQVRIGREKRKRKQ